MTSPLETRRRALTPMGLGRAPLLLLLLALPASAQSARGPDLAPLPPPHLTTGEAIPLDVETPAPVPERPHGVARVAAELGGTLVGTVGMGVAGAFVGGLVSASVCDSADLFRLQLPSSCFSGALLGGVVGAGVGVPLGVWWGGGKAGGNGRLAGALGGFGVSVASAGAAHLLGAEDLGVVLLATSPVLSILGYELTDSAPGALSPTEVTPTVSVSAGHATFGLQGRF